MDTRTKLRHYRELRGYTQTELARRLGVSQSVISKAEGDKRNLGMENWCRLADLLGVDPRELTGRGIREESLPHKRRD